jgi:hypothetical protein
MNYIKRQQASALKSYEKHLANATKMLPMWDAMLKAAKFWACMTGEDTTVDGDSPTYAAIYVYMGRLMANGKYPSIAREVALLIEKMDELLEGLVPFDSFEYDQDKSYTTLTWVAGEHRLVVYVTHGGNCTYTQVGTKTKIVEEPIYEVTCK